jgi:hypothetical protein
MRESRCENEWPPEYGQFRFWAPCSRGKAEDSYVLDATTTMINVFDYTSLIPLPYHYLTTGARILGWTLLFSFLLVLYATKDITTRFFKPLYNPSPLRELKGPVGGGPVVGHAKYFSRTGHEPDNWVIKVFEKYGHVNVMRGLWNVCPSTFIPFRIHLTEVYTPGQSSVLSTTDLKAIGHVLNHPHIYRKSPQLRFEFEMFIGDGIVVAEGEDHKRQRKIMNPAFGLIPIREMCKTFVEKAKEVKEGIESLFDYKDGQDMSQLEKEVDVKGRDYVETDMVSWISRAALDIIGLTGFNHNFNSVKSHSKKTKGSLSDDELYTALEEIFVATQLGFRFMFLKIWIPWLRLWKWDKTSKMLRRSHAIMNRIGKKLVDEKVQAIKEGTVDGREKDLLTLLIKANLQEVEGKKMTEKEVLNQIPTFLIAGEFSHKYASDKMMTDLRQHTNQLLLP